jgi:hypothetical protein
MSPSFPFAFSFWIRVFVHFGRVFDSFSGVENYVLSENPRIPHGILTFVEFVQNPSESKNLDESE